MAAAAMWGIAMPDGSWSIVASSARRCAAAVLLRMGAAGPSASSLVKPAAGRPSSPSAAPRLPVVPFLRSYLPSVCVHVRAMPELCWLWAIRRAGGQCAAPVTGPFLLNRQAFPLPNQASPSTHRRCSFPLSGLMLLSYAAAAGLIFPVIIRIHLLDTIFCSPLVLSLLSVRKNSDVATSTCYFVHSDARNHLSSFISIC
ncbi:hypothetical protein SETIT_1G075000v2 [Setaria italica]|uniref:Uncharacterized protein n=1 Tax=Setaria italica TaxID=4555 RepID=A0A368PIS4_SETIT|nr:hypothetical protein SETIT_1G075000v2 [Setaria italica]